MSTTRTTSSIRIHRMLSWAGTAMLFGGAALAAASPARAADGGSATLNPLSVERSCKTPGKSGSPDKAYYSSVVLRGSNTGSSTFTFDSLTVQSNPALTQITPKQVTVPAGSTTTVTVQVTGAKNSANGPAVLKATVNQGGTTTQHAGTVTSFYPMQTADCGVSYPSNVNKPWPVSGGTVVSVDTAGNPQYVPATLATGVTKVFAGYDGEFALKSDGSVVSWSAGGGSALLPTAYNNVRSIDVAPALDGSDTPYRLAVTPDGTVVGEGDGPAFSGMVGRTGMKAVSTGEWYSVGLTTQGTVVMAGQSECGTGWVPDGLNHVTQVLEGYEGNTMALKDDGTVVTWGCTYGEMAPVPAEAHDIVKIADGENSFHAALRKDGAVIVWSDNDPYGFTPRIVATGATNMTMIGDGEFSVTAPSVLAQGQDGTVNRIDVRSGTSTPVPSMTGAASLEGRGDIALAIVPTA